MYPFQLIEGLALVTELFSTIHALYVDPVDQQEQLTDCLSYALEMHVFGMPVSDMSPEETDWYTSVSYSQTEAGDITVTAIKAAVCNAKTEEVIILPTISESVVGDYRAEVDKKQAERFAQAILQLKLEHHPDCRL